MKLSSIKLYLLFLLGFFIAMPNCFASSISYFIYDSPNRSITALVNSAQVIVNNYSYNSFGNITLQNESAINVYKYDGEQNEQETGLIFLRNRYYDPVSGRFISKDDMLGVIKDPLSLNSYIYVENNPINFIDSIGLFRYTASISANYINLGGAIEYSRDSNQSVARLTASQQTEIGAIVDAGISAGISDISGTGGNNAGTTYSIGKLLGPYAAVSITLANTPIPNTLNQGTSTVTLIKSRGE